MCNQSDVVEKALHKPHCLSLQYVEVSESEQLLNSETTRLINVSMKNEGDVSSENVPASSSATHLLMKCVKCVLLKCLVTDKLSDGDVVGESDYDCNRDCFNDIFAAEGLRNQCNPAWAPRKQAGAPSIT